MISEAQKRQMRDAVAKIRAKMADAARAAGRDPKDVLFRDITITAQEPALPLKLCSDVSFTNLCCKPAAK